MSELTCCNFNDFLMAIRDSTRQQILRLLESRELNVKELNQHFPVEQATISYHLSILRRANLVTASRQGKYVYYRTNPACVTECCEEILSRFKIPAGNLAIKIFSREGDSDDEISS